MRFPTLADFAIKRKMMSGGGHVSTNETIENSEHSIIRKTSRLQL